ncbi:hypothetical protein N7532_003934 [Penicillium argentinense]|uniref:Hypervirulence associated protein TUDOR domain-containing protein n=1 Tax=Penicillium argentinense TaxID=1131581 RepID=A0A9W9FND8_9EURO|nr:uncharacterized protein N7532_003934 [Penicillium argentinense]KAJ5103405.1 hypothetical protein N7532_003934 [Penicillium argentinense]
MPAFKNGDRVNYKAVGGRTPIEHCRNSHTNQSVGVIRNVCTSTASLTGRIVEASEEEPHYEVENENTRKRSAVKEGNILGPAE